MDAPPTKPRGTVVMSVALHVVIVGLFTVGVKFPSRPAFSAAPAPIQGVIIDQSVITKEQQRREQVARAEQQRKQREERAERERVQQARRDKEAAEQRERDRVAEERKQQVERERMAQEAKERAEAAKREQERLAREKAEQERVAREKAEQAKREEAARKEREAALARQRAQAESDLQAQLAREAEQQAAIASGLQDEYVRLIADKIERNWNKPLSAKPGLECVVNVVQIPGGDVIDAKVAACNGDDAVVRSIEDAVRRASPLPPPPSQAVFQRNIRVTFRPDS